MCRLGNVVQNYATTVTEQSLRACVQSRASKRFLFVYLCPMTDGVGWINSGAILSGPITHHQVMRFYIPISPRHLVVVP